jgi:lipoprotein-anchoring transpeptidase ErfK/SrfK
MPSHLPVKGGLSAAAAPHRRHFLAGAACLLPLALGACNSARLEIAPPPRRRSASPFPPEEIYGAIDDPLHPLDPVDLSEIDPAYFRTIVAFDSSLEPGTLAIDTSDRFLYLVQEGGQAIRYGVGVGREGATWRGRATIARKSQWPGWTPTQAMIRRDPERNGPWAGGMPGGPENPLGARALYLYANGKDTLYRIHGTNEPWSIGQNVSSGCIRLINHDIIDLYERVPTGSAVIVRD